MQLLDFWDRLTPSARRTLNKEVGGPLIKKTLEKIVANYLNMQINGIQITTKEEKSLGVHQVDSNTFVQAQLDFIATEIKKLTLAKV